MNPQPRDLPAWLAYQERINPRLIDLGLERVRPVAARLGLDSLASPVITIAGTNGKGSTVAFLEALAIAHGLQPGCYVSPWLLRYNESVRIRGRTVEDAALVAAFRAVEAARHDVALTAFEFRTLAAVYAIRASGADLYLLEVGLGGRLDAVNLFDARVGVITSIGLDHQEWLGDTLQQIAEEKAGIARAGAPLVCGSRECGEWVGHTRAAREAQIVVAGRDFHAREEGGAWRFDGLGLTLEGLPLPGLAGAHQVHNAAAALAAFSLSQVTPLVPERVAGAVSGARVMGRLQHLEGPPERFVDVAHNAHAAVAVAHWLRAHPDPRTVHAVCAMYADKDCGATLEALADVVDEWWLATLPGPRGGGAERLDAALPASVPQDRRRLFTSVEAAWNAACESAGPEARVLALGSFETVRRVLRLESAGRDLDT